LTQPQAHDVANRLQHSPTAIATVNAAALDDELSSFLFETMNGIETEQTLALNSEPSVF
jgi:hypothetical protein